MTPDPLSATGGVEFEGAPPCIDAAVRAAVESLVERADPAQDEVHRHVSAGKVRALQAILQYLSASPEAESPSLRSARGAKVAP